MAIYNHSIHLTLIALSSQLVAIITGGHSRNRCTRCQNNSPKAESSQVAVDEKQIQYLTKPVS